MQIKPFESRRNEDTPKFRSFQIMTCVPIWWARGKLEAKTWVFKKIIFGRS
jgi:hypothetical protein